MRKGMDRTASWAALRLRGFWGVELPGTLHLWHHPRWSPSPVAWRRRNWTGGTPLAFADLCWQMECEMLQKGDSRRVEGSPGGVITDPAFSAQYPVLWSYMTQARWDDGSARQTSSLLIFSDGAVLKGMLRDRDAGLCLWAASGAVTDLFEVLEGLLCSPATEWRQDRQQAGQQAKRIKKGSGHG